MQWFGPTWNAPICNSQDKAATPVGWACAACGIEIKGGDRGFLIPHMDHDNTDSKPWHLRCLLNAVGVAELIAEAATKRTPAEDETHEPPPAEEPLRDEDDG